MQIKGSFRIAYFVQVALIVIVFLVLILLLLRDAGTNSPLNENRYWFGLVAFIWLFGGAFFFALRHVFFISLDDHEILFTSLIGKTFRYKFEDILRIESKSATLKQRFYSSAGYQILNIEFTDGRELEISANVYANFDKLKGQIYQHTRGQHNSA